jgi:hypothetical protein
VGKFAFNDVSHCPQVYLERKVSDSQGNGALDNENWNEVAHLLGRKHHIIDSMHALTLVPDEVHKSACAPILTPHSLRCKDMSS